MLNISGISIGTSTPFSGGIKFSDGSEQTTAASAGSVTAANISSGTFGSNVSYGNFSFYKDAGTPILQVDATNARIGIGTTGPGNKLHIYTTASADGLSIDGTANPGLNLRNAGTIKAFIGMVTANGAWVAGSLINDTVFRAQNANIHFTTNGGTSALMTLSSSSNVGIGITSPAQKLDVAGTVQMTGFKLTTAPISGYVLTSDAAGVGTWQAAAGGIGGSGTTNYISKWTAGTTLGNSIIYDNGTNVGIGTTSPSGKLSVVGSSNDFGLDTGVYPGIGRIWYKSDGTGYGLSIGRKAIDNSYSDYVYIKDGGNVGIGITSPAQKLDVAGTVQMTGFKLTTAPISGYVLTSDAAGVGTWQAAAGGIGGSGTTNYISKWTAGTTLGNSIIYDNGTNVGIGTASPNRLLHVYKDSGDNAEIDIQSVAGANKHWAIYQDRTTSDLRFWHNDISGEKNALTLKNSGNVGIGTTSPGAKLEVSGTFKATATSTFGGVIKSVTGDVIIQLGP